ncbi:MAG: hypothetical protein H6608_02190 [Flavobacteriales bacterium]|nr:hypothetical protein [Bacteroidota bacterium]MCB9239917.1 hypothetical protein [Flavobacteriales bacterium]
MKKLLYGAAAILFLSVGAYSCKDDGASSTPNTSTGKITDSQKAKLYDKEWYYSGGTGIVHEFLNDGTLRLSKSLDGRWNWVNKGDTMDIKDHTNARYQYLFISIDDHTMSFKASVDNFSGTFNYKDTE